jgi:predicted dehydrogenase
VDFLSWMAGAPPVRVFADSLGTSENRDCVNVNIEFLDGSIGTIGYYSNGCAAAGKEYFEIHRNGVSATITDFKEATILGEGMRQRKRLWNQDKGQATMVRSFLSSVTEGRPFDACFDDFCSTTAATFAIIDSLSARCPMPVQCVPYEPLRASAS